MLNRIVTLLRHWRDVRTSLGTLSRAWGGDSSIDMVGGLTQEEIEGLISWLPEQGVFVEVGTLFGLTAKAIAAAKPNLKVIAVDNFSWNPFGLPPAVHEAFTRRILDQELKRGQIELLNTSSEQFRKQVAESVPDAIFFDAQHQYEPVKSEITWAKSVGIPLISGHDYNNPNPRFGVTQAVNEVFGPASVECAGMCWRVLVP